VLTLAISAVCGIIAAQFGYYQLPGSSWGVFLGAGGFAVPLFAITFVVRRKFQKIVNGVQNRTQQEQQQLQRRISQMQASGSGSAKGAQKQIEKKQTEVIQNAIQELEQAQPLCKWNIAGERQLNTLKGSFYYQIGEFKKADECLRKCFAFDPMIMAMKMARCYQNGDLKQVHKLYKRGTRRFRKDKGTILYALYSWILVKQNQIDEAIQVLSKGAEKTGSEVLQENWKNLSNNKVRQFSNAGLGEQWYALLLETPKPPKSRKKVSRRRK